MIKRIPKRWLALFVLCLGDLMIVLDGTIVNVALPSIREQLQFTETGLVWVVNAYLLTFGGFLLLGGRLGDIFGARRLFLVGITLFTVASVACGFSQSQTMLIAARALQGIGGAIVSAIALALTMNLFPEPAERARAMGIFGFVMSGGGAIGVFLGGFLTSALTWHWIFLVNLPVGVLVFIAARMLLPVTKPTEDSKHIDLLGATTITLSLMLATFAIVGGNEAGWMSFQTLGMLAAAVAVFLGFLKIESTVKSPLVPLSIFKVRSVAVSNIVGVLWAVAMFAWFMISALYLQAVLGYTPLQVGLSFLPANIVMGVFSYKWSAQLVLKYGIKKPLGVGLSLASLGLLSFAFAPVGGSFLVNVLPGMILLGLGGGIAFNPILLAAMNDVSDEESGLASGVVNTSFMMGGAVGLAILASAAASTTEGLRAGGVDPLTALTAGYHTAFFLGAIFAALAAVIGMVFLRINKLSSHAHAH
jgi:EmrB/QacA subfamily drug resistance transporter